AASQSAGPNPLALPFFTEAAPPSCKVDPRGIHLSGDHSTKKKLLRSENWFNDPAEPGETAIYIDRYMTWGLTREELQSGRPIIGISQSGSELTPCNRIHLSLAARVKDGIRDAGGIPIEFPLHPMQE